MSEAMTEFKVGDRVKVYGCYQSHINGHTPFVAEVSQVWESSDDGLTVRVDDLNAKRAYLVHPKQCRKLKKKIKPVLWINWASKVGDGSYYQTSWGYPGTNVNGNDWKPYREIKGAVPPKENW